MNPFLIGILNNKPNDDEHGYLLTEGGDFLLTEDGDKIILEDL